MKRVFVLVLDSFGVGSSEDANLFDDTGSNTFGHIAEYCYFNINGYGKKNILYIPNLVSLGLNHIYKAIYGNFPDGVITLNSMIGSYGYASEISSSKDTTSGHWEIAGAPVLFKWDYFNDIKNSFPTTLINDIILKCNINGVLGNCHASGTDILNHLGEKHISTKKPILYTSSDSVFQIACHEEIFGLNNLYNLCKKVRKILNKYNLNIARVIARPFVGNKKFHFIRTGNRKDFSQPPHQTTILEKFIKERDGSVIAIGKISDIFAHVGITRNIPSVGLNNLINSTINMIQSSGTNTIVFVNFVDFDSIWGHRRDVIGYAKGLELFDKKLPKILHALHEEDLLIITADHGCDPTWTGTDHTREYVPILLYNKLILNQFLGHRKTFSDIAQTITKYFSLLPIKYGTSII